MINFHCTRRIKLLITPIGQNVTEQCRIYLGMLSKCLPDLLERSGKVSQIIISRKQDVPLGVSNGEITVSAQPECRAMNQPNIHTLCQMVWQKARWCPLQRNRVRHSLLRLLGDTARPHQPLRTQGADQHLQ